MANSKSSSSVLNIYLIIQPIIFLFLTIFVFRSNIKIFFLLSILMLVAMFFALKGREKDSQKKLAYIIVALASIGLAAACILTIEKIELLENPNFITSCSFSPIVACSPVIGSPQATAIDSIPNPFFGIFGFACLMTAGMTILAGARKLSKIWWLTLFAGICFGVIFCIWLFYEGLYEIGALCLYCLSVWLVTFSLFWVVLSELLEQKYLKINSKLDSLIIKNRNTLITITVAIIALLIYFRWSDYWNSLL
jgi:uncharacterized membrane protein